MFNGDFYNMLLFINDILRIICYNEINKYETSALSVKNAIKIEQYDHISLFVTSMGCHILTLNKINDKL